MDREWKDFRGLSHLETLSLLTARLLRLTLFEKLSRGEAQLQASGFEVNLKTPFKKWAKEENAQLLPYNESTKKLSLIVKRKRNDF